MKNGRTHRVKYDINDKFAISILAIVIGYVEGKYGHDPDRISQDDIFNNAMNMFKRLIENSKLPVSKSKLKGRVGKVKGSK